MPPPQKETRGQDGALGGLGLLGEKLQTCPIGRQVLVADRETLWLLPSRTTWMARRTGPDARLPFLVRQARQYGQFSPGFCGR